MPKFKPSGYAESMVKPGASAPVLMEHLRLLWPDDQRLAGDNYSPPAVKRVKDWQKQLGPAIVAKPDGGVGSDTWAALGRVAGEQASGYAGIPSAWLAPKSAVTAVAQQMPFVRPATGAAELALQSAAPALVGNFRFDYGTFFAEFYREFKPLAGPDRVALAQLLWAIDTDVFLAKMAGKEADVLPRSAAYFLATALHEAVGFVPNQEHLVAALREAVAPGEKTPYPLADERIERRAAKYEEAYSVSKVQQAMDEIGPNVKDYCKLMDVKAAIGTRKRLYNGRGLVHITWDYNYEKFDALLHGRKGARYVRQKQAPQVAGRNIVGVPEAVLLAPDQDLFASPQLAYDAQIAYATLSIGVRQNLWIGSGGRDRFLGYMRGSQARYGEARLLVNPSPKQGPGGGWPWATNVDKFRAQGPILERIVRASTRPRPAWASLLPAAKLQEWARIWTAAPVTRRLTEFVDRVQAQFGKAAPAHGKGAR